MSDTATTYHSLADIPELVGFFSYSRDDDDDSRGALSALRDAIQRELRGQLGRSRRQLRLWQDKQAIAPGRLWESEIKAAVAQAVFFIPIITPTVVKSGHCRTEFEAFLERERELGRSDLVFPILYIRVPELEDEARWRHNPVLSVIGVRQWVDWRALRLRGLDDIDLRRAIEEFCTRIAEALAAPMPMLSQQELEGPQVEEEERGPRRRDEHERQEDNAPLVGKAAPIAVDPAPAASAPASPTTSAPEAAIAAAPRRRLGLVVAATTIAVAAGLGVMGYRAELFAPSKPNANQHASRLQIPAAPPVAEPMLPPPPLEVKPPRTPPTVTSKSVTIIGNSVAAPLDTPMPTDRNDVLSSLVITVTGLPTNGNVVMSDGMAPVSKGQTLTADQLIGLRFTPTRDVFDQSSTFSYSVKNTAGLSAEGRVSVTIGPKPAPPPAAQPTPAPEPKLTAPPPPILATPPSLPVAASPADARGAYSDAANRVTPRRLLFRRDRRRIGARHCSRDPAVQSAGGETSRYPDREPRIRHDRTRTQRPGLRSAAPG